MTRVGDTASRSAVERSRRTEPGVTDFDLRGHVGVRVIDGRPSDVSVVERQLGPLRNALGREPDVTIRFVDRLPASGPLRYLGLDEYGFSDDAFLVLRSRFKLPARVAVPLDRVGGPCEIVCERGIHAVPLLLPIVNLTALANGAVPIHGSAFVHDGRGILVAGWAKGGKTETLLAFVERGARYVADEWVYLTAEGTMFGVPEPIRFWSWHLDQVPVLRSRVPAAARGRVALTALTADALDRAAALGRGPAAARLTVSRLGPLVRRRASVQVPPSRAFGCGELVERARIDHVVLAVSHGEQGYRAEPLDGAAIARRMSASVRFEWHDMLGAYQAFRFAFPDRRNALLDTLEDCHTDALVRVLESVPGSLLTHPYPPRISRLFDALAPRLAASSDGPC